MYNNPIRVALSLFIFLFVSSHVTQAQIYNPVKWSADCKQLADDKYELTISASIQNGWHIYSMNIGDEGPIPTELVIESEVEKFGDVKESSSKRIEGYDDYFDMELVKLKNDASYTQTIRTTKPNEIISGYITFMACDKTKCLPPTDEEFSISISTCSGPQSISSDTENSPPIVAGLDKKHTETTDIQVADKRTKNNLEQEDQAILSKSSQNDSSPETINASEKTPSSEQSQANIESIDRKDKSDNIGILNPVKWSGQIKETTDGNRELLFHANIAEGWNIYSKDIKGDGPVPTSVVFGEKDSIGQIGDLQENAELLTKEYDKNFEMELVKLKKSADYSIQIKPNGNLEKFGGYIEYMACTSSKCIFPEPVEFLADPKNLTLTLGPDVYTQYVEGDKTGSLGETESLPFANLNQEKLDNPSGECITENRAAIKKKGLSNIFLLGFFGGLIALLTPCVFPMIPLTVSYFTKGSENRKKGVTNAFLYGFFILAVYLLLSVPFHLMDSLNPDILNNISTNVWLNLLFFAIFMFFAFSFFGYYELTLPSSWTNKTSSAENVGGLLGIFFMALTLALVSFSCTGPILGSLLAGALTSDGGAMQLTSGMGGFGLALALPFGLFAAFPSFMSKLPHSGGWLNTVKVVLGFLELALAFKFLSNADLVKHWGLLKIEPFLAIWILVFLGLALYLFGLLKFPHDSPIKKLGIPRLGFGALSLLFMFYLMTGFRFNDTTESFSPLTLLSGLAPPVGYSWIYPKECPQNFNCFKDFDDGLAYAKEQEKPILLDFTGHACVNCRKMEEHVWPTSAVKKFIADDYVLVSLYVDDKTKLPESEQVVVQRATGGTRKLRTIGDKWQHFQTKYFKNNSQPYYVLLSPDGDLLNNPVPYTPDENEYAAFLACGIQNFKDLE